MILILLEIIKSFAVLQTINKEYLQLKTKFSGDSLYNAIAKNLKEKLSLSANLKQFYDEDLDLYIRYRIS